MLIKIFRVIAFLEGLSFIILLFVAMPLKYVFDLPEYVRVIGMMHGVLFIAYILLLVYRQMEFKKRFGGKEIWKFYLASVVPFGTFYIEFKYLRGKVNG